MSNLSESSSPTTQPATVDSTMDSTKLELWGSLPYFSEDSLPTTEDTTSNLEVVSSNPPLPHTTFSPFCKLPAEIQLDIWEAARPDPRFLKLYCIHCSRHWLPSNGAFCPNKTHHVRSRAPVPALLHACSDSRKVALKWYKLSFGNALAWIPPAVYFDWERDGLYTKCNGVHTHGRRCLHDAFYAYFQEEDEANLKRIALYLPHLRQGRQQHWELLPPWIPSLKDVYFIQGGRTRRGIAAGRRDVFGEKDLVLSEEPFCWQWGRSLRGAYDKWYVDWKAKLLQGGINIGPKHEFRTLERVNFVRRGRNNLAWSRDTSCAFFHYSENDKPGLACPIRLLVS